MKALKQVVIDTFATLLSPKAYFSTLPKEGGLWYPILKIIIYGFFAMFIFSLVYINMLDTAKYTVIKNYVWLIPIIISVLSPFISFFILILETMIFLIIARLCGAKTDFITGSKIAASLAVTMPLSSILGYFNLISPAMGIVISILVGTLTIWIAYNAIVYKFGTNKKRTATLLIIFLVILLTLNLIGIGVAKQAQTNQLLQQPTFND